MLRVLQLKVLLTRLLKKNNARACPRDADAARVATQSVADQTSQKNNRRACPHKGFVARKLRF